MAWDDQQPPWGQKKGPPTPEELIANLIKKIKDAFDNNPELPNLLCPLGAARDVDRATYSLWCPAGSDPKAGPSAVYGR